jgi:hypothetical protein
MTLGVGLGGMVAVVVVGRVRAGEAGGLGPLVRNRAAGLSFDERRTGGASLRWGRTPGSGVCLVKWCGGGWRGVREVEGRCGAAPQKPSRALGFGYQSARGGVYFRGEGSPGVGVRCWRVGLVVELACSGMYLPGTCPHPLPSSHSFLFSPLFLPNHSSRLPGGPGICLLRAREVVVEGWKRNKWGLRFVHDSDLRTY